MHFVNTLPARDYAAAGVLLYYIQVLIPPIVLASIAHKNLI